ncbi:MAG: leucine-rich repeat domain-containing protein [Candidatus Poribacteria bacterium]|nr:leucine-rich repeat domain-containing protein [Candidatus Poribacteria bacterium]
MLGIWVEIGTTQTITETDMPDAKLRAEVLATLISYNILQTGATTFTQQDMAHSKFKNLHAPKKEISDLTGLQYATNLTILYLAENSISAISATSLPTSLTSLNLTHNSISDISGVSGLTSLTDLAINNNSVSAIPDLSNLTNLTSLSLNNNSITAIPTSLPASLTILYLSHNSIAAIPTSLPTSLTNLYLNNNSVSAIPNLSGLTNLIYLDLAHNSITAIPTNLPTSLTNLHLSNNRITEIPDLFGTSLTDLYLNDNSITTIPTNLPTSLTILYLAGNSISDISGVSGLTSLTGLYLSNNRITEIPDLSGLTNLGFLDLHGHRITDINQFLKLKSIPTSNIGSINLRLRLGLKWDWAYYILTRDRDRLPTYLYVPPPLTVTFENYPEKPPTDEFTLTIRFPESVTGFEAEDITVETELKRGTGTATLKALTLIGRTEETNDAGEIAVFAQTYFAKIKLPPNTAGTVKLIVHPGAARTAWGRITPPTAIASEPIEFGRRGPLVFPSYVAMDKVIFNEFRNAEDDQNDWVELKNISDKAVSLKDWEISMVASEGEHLNIDRDVVAFPDWTLPPGGILLILNTDPSENDLLRGQDIENPNHNPELRPLYLIRLEMKLPRSPYLLILRNARNKNGTWEAFEDVAGDYHRGDVNFRTQIWPLRDTWVYTGTGARFSEGDVYQRVLTQRFLTYKEANVPKARGYFHDAWTVSDYQSGLGYDLEASPETSLGTPGYPGAVISDEVGTAQISFSEVMFATNERGVPSQWIELYNNSATEIINLEGWKLSIEVRDHQPVHRHTTFHFKSLEVMPNQTVLLVARKDRSSGNIPARRIYDVQRQNRKALLLRPEGFLLGLFSTDGTLVDMAGNLDGKMGQDKPRWELPSGWSESGKRSSLIRRYEERLPSQGTRLGGWVRAGDTALLVGYSYYGLPTDDGTPGYRQGSPLPVELSSLYADLREASVVVKWTTASEMENAGFNILRGETRKGKFVKVNPTLILGAGTTAEQNTYTYTDTTAKPNTAHYYRIEDVSLSGNRRHLATVRMRGHLSATGKLLGTWGALRVVD